MSLAQKVSEYERLLKHRSIVRALMLASPTTGDWLAWEEIDAQLGAQIAGLELPTHLLAEQRAREEEA